MDLPIHIDTINMEMLILYFKGSYVEISFNYDIFLFLRVVIILANSADPDEMFARVHFWGFLVYKWLRHVFASE